MTKRKARVETIKKPDSWLIHNPLFIINKAFMQYAALLMI